MLGKRFARNAATSSRSSKMMTKNFVLYPIRTVTLVIVQHMAVLIHRKVKTPICARLLQKTPICSRSVPDICPITNNPAHFGNKAWNVPDYYKNPDICPIVSRNVPDHNRTRVLDRNARTCSRFEFRKFSQVHGLCMFCLFVCFHAHMNALFSF